MVRAWVTDLAERAGAANPSQFARELTLLFDGGLAGVSSIPIRQGPKRPSP